MKAPSLIGTSAIGTSALVVLTLAATGCQSAAGSEPGPQKTANAGAGSARWQVSYVSGSMEAGLTDVTAVSADEGWAIGHSAEDPTSEPRQVLLHRTGGKWRGSALPSAFGDATLSRIDSSAPDNVWLFGSRGNGSESEPVAARWDGSRWVTRPAPPGGGVGVRASAVLGKNDVWALNGQEGAAHWDGARWKSEKLPATATSLSGSGPNDVWAVGFRDVAGDGPMSQPAAMHWDGKSWKTTKTPEYTYPAPSPAEETAALDSVAAVSGDEVWAIGTHTFNHGEGDGPEPADEKILLRWDGNAWHKLPAEVTAKAGLGSAPDGAGGLVMGRGWHLTAGGDLRRIAAHDPVPGRSGKVTETDKKQKYYPERAVAVPGGHQVWSVGLIELGAYGDANFRRGTVLSHDVE